MSEKERAVAPRRTGINCGDAEKERNENGRLKMDAANETGTTQDSGQGNERETRAVQRKL
jgi:hypothetical protein